MFKSLRKSEQEMSVPSNSNRLPEIVLFGDSLTEWSFDDCTQGFGLHFEKMYAGKARIVNEASFQTFWQSNMADTKHLPEIVLFGASMTEWSFRDKTQGLGWFLTKMYDGKASVLNEGQAGYTSTRLRSDFDRIIQRATSPTTPPTLLFTIFLGANDACIMGADAMVPWPAFSANIRAFIETILTQDGGLSETKIAVISPPPLNGPEAKGDSRGDNEWLKQGPRYKTYMSKKRYAEGLMEIAGEYEETGRVVGVDYWRAMVEKSGFGTWEEFEETGLWPGCGLLGARSFEKGWFTDGLHLDVKGYAVLNELVVEKVLGKWPDLGAETL